MPFGLGLRARPSASVVRARRPDGPPARRAARPPCGPLARGREDRGSGAVVAWGRLGAGSWGRGGAPRPRPPHRTPRGERTRTSATTSSSSFAWRHGWGRSAAPRQAGRRTNSHKCEHFLEFVRIRHPDNPRGGPAGRREANELAQVRPLRRVRSHPPPRQPARRSPAPSRPRSSPAAGDQRAGGPAARFRGGRRRAGRTEPSEASPAGAEAPPRSGLRSPRRPTPTRRRAARAPGDRDADEAADDHRARGAQRRGADAPDDEAVAGAADGGGARGRGRERARREAPRAPRGGSGRRRARSPRRWGAVVHRECVGVFIGRRLRQDTADGAGARRDHALLADEPEPGAVGETAVG